MSIPAHFRTPILAATTLWLLSACTTYERAPIDLEVHRAAFARRLESGAVEAFALRLRATTAVDCDFDPSDGITCEEGQLLALVFNPALRTARLQAGITAAARDTAGIWADPQLTGNFERILPNVVEPWLLAGALQFTLPITGRKGLEQWLATAAHDTRIALARAAEARVLRDLQATWTRWSTTTRKHQLLEELIEQLDELVAIAQRLSAAGEVSNLDARAFELERLTRVLERQQVLAETHDLRADLLAFMGLAPDTQVTLAPLGKITRQPPSDVDPLASSPAVAVAELAYEQAERQLQLEIRKQWPSLVLAPGFGEEDGDARGLLSFSLPIPLWNGNARLIAEARAQREVAGDKLRAAMEVTASEFARRERRLNAALERRRIVEQELVPLAERQVEDGRRMLELGNLDTLLLLDALLRAHTARTTVLDAAQAEALATNDINRLFWPDLTHTPFEANDR